MITIDLANAIFIFCVAVGGILLLITVLLDDILGGLLNFLHLGFDLGGVTLMPLLLGFVSMFGVGGLFGTQMFGLRDLAGINARPALRRRWCRSRVCRLRRAAPR